jgi:hypothetical protein
MLRLLRGEDLAATAGVLRRARSAELEAPDATVAAAIATTVEQGLMILNAESARGCALAGRAAAGRDGPTVVAASLAVLVQRLLGLVQE